MVVDAVRAYLEAASGLTELTRKHAVTAAKTLLRESDERSGAATRGDGGRNAAGDGESTVRGMRVGHSIQALADELIETSRANRAAIGHLIEGEVRRVLDRLDVVPRDEHDRLARRVAELERRLAAVTAAQRRRTAAEDRQAAQAAPAETGGPAVVEGTAPPSDGPATEAGTTQQRRPEPPRSETPDTGTPEAETPEAETPDTGTRRAESSKAAATSIASPPATRGTKTKATRSRTPKNQGKRAASRKSSGSAKNGGGR